MINLDITGPEKIIRSKDPLTSRTFTLGRPVLHADNTDYKLLHVAFLPVPSKKKNAKTQTKCTTVKNPNKTF